MEILQSNLDDVLKEKDLTAEQLADEADLPRMTIFNARRGKNITMVNALKIAAVLKVPLERIWQNE